MSEAETGRAGLRPLGSNPAPSASSGDPNSASAGFASTRFASARFASTRFASTGLPAAALLLLGAVVSGIGAVLGVAHTFDASPVGRSSGAVWVILVPPILALLALVRRPLIGTAVVAGVGVVALARLSTDISLLNGPNAVVRPELFYEITNAAQPFSTATGAYLVVLGDAGMVLAGLLAGRRLSSRVAGRSDRIFAAGPLESAPAPAGPELLAQALESAESGDATEAQGHALGRRPARSNRLIIAGFCGTLVLLAASLSLPYSGGYLARRYLPPQLDLWGLAAAVLLAAVCALVVLVSAIAPRTLAVGLLSGVAAGAAVPFLTAVVVRASGAPVQLNAVVGLGLAGAGLLASAGLWNGSRPVVVDDYGDQPTGAAARKNILGALLTLAVAIASGVAWRAAQLSYNGGPDPALGSGFPISASLHVPFLVGMLICLVGGVLWLIPPLATAGRAVSSIGWLALLFGVTQSLNLLGQLQISASVPNAGFAPPRWSIGVGLWCAIIGIVVGVIVLGIALSAGRQAAQATVLIADDDSMVTFRAFGTVVAGVLTVLTVVALGLPIYRTTDGASVTDLAGFALNWWGVAAIGAGMICAAWAAARASSAFQAAAFASVGAAILLARLLIPDSVRAEEGFTVEAGLYVGYAVLLAFVGAAVLLGLAAGRVPMVGPTPALSKPPAKPAPDVRGTARGRGRAAVVRPSGKRSGAPAQRKKGRSK